MSGVRESGPETPGTEQRKRKGSPGESLDPRSQWIAEKRRREQEQRYVEELAELVSANLAEFVGNVKPDTCAVLRETVLQIRQLKRQEQEQCASSRGEVQQPDISSSGQSVIEKDSLGPLLLKALDAFFFVVNAEGYLAFVSENVRCYLGFGQEELLNSYVYNLLHIGDHEEFSRHLPKPPANSTPWHSDGTRHSSHTFHCRMLVHRSSNEAATPAAEDQYETMQCFAVVQPPAADESDGDLQPCLICVARRAQRHEMPTVETFSTRQDKTGKIIAIDTSSLQASMRPGWQILVRKCIHAFFQNVENGLPLSHRHHRDVLMKGFAQSAPYRFALPDGSMAVGQSKSRMQALPNQTHIVSSIHTVFRYCKHSGEGLVRPSPVIPDQISATNDPNGGAPSASLNCPQTPMGIVSGRSDVSMGRLPPGAPPPGRYVGMPGAMALGSPSRNSPCGAVGSGPMPCQGSYMRTPRTPPVAKPVGSPGMPFSPQRPSGPYLTNAGFACPGASPGEGITPGSGTPPGQTPSPSPRLVSPSPSVTSPCQVVTPSVGQRIPYVPRSYSTGHYGKQEDWSAEGKEQIATATPGSTQQNIECSQADGTTQECEEPAKSPTKLLQLLTVGPEVGGRLSLDSVRSSEPPGSGPATSNSGSNTDGSGSGITGGGAAGCAGGGGVSPSLHSTSLTERHKILHKLLQDGSSSPDINKLTASQQPLSVGSGQGSIKAEELSTVKQEPVSPLQRRQDRDHALLRSLLDKEEEQRTRPVEHLPDSDVKPKLEKSEGGRDVSYGPGVCGSIKIEKPDMQVKVESGEQHTPDRFENLNEGLGRESTAENSKALLQDLLQTPSSMPSLQASSNFRTASSHVVAAMGRANSQLMSRPPFPNGPGQSRPLISYSTSLSHVQGGGPTHSVTAPTHHGMVPGPGHARRSSMPGSDVWVAPGSMGMCQPQAGTAPGISGYPAMQNMLGSPTVSMPMRQVSQSNSMIDAGSGEVILGMDEMQYSAQHQGGWNEGVVSVEGTGLTEHRRIGFLTTHEGMVCPPGPGETVADDSALMEQLHSLLSNADEQELAEIDRALGIDKLVQGGVLDCPIYQSSVEMGPMGLDPKHMMSYQGHPVYAGHITTPGYPAYGDVAPGAPPTYSPGWGVRGTTQYVPRQLHPLQARQAAALRGMRPVMGTGAPGGTFPNSAQLRFQLQQRLQGQQMSHGRLTMMGQCYGGPAEGATLRGSMPQAMAGRVRAVCHPTSHEQVPLNAQMLAQRHREMVNQQLRQQQLMHQQQQQQQQHQQQQQQQQRVSAMAQAPGSGFPGVVPQSPGQLGRPPGQQPAYPTGYPTVYNSPPPPQPSSPYPVASGNSLPPQAMTQTVGGSMHVRAGVMGTDIGQFAPSMGQPGVFQFNSGMSQSPEGSYGTPAGSVSPLLSPRLQQQALQMDSEVKAWEGGGIRSASALYHQQYAQPGTPGIFGNMELPDSMTTTNGEPGAAMAQMTPDLPPDIGPGQGFC